MAYTGNLHTQEAETGPKQTQDLTLWPRPDATTGICMSIRGICCLEKESRDSALPGLFSSWFLPCASMDNVSSILNPGTNLWEGKTKMNIKCLVTRLKKLSHVKAHQECTPDRLTESCLSLFPLSLSPFFSHSLASFAFLGCFNLRPCTC